MTASEVLKHIVLPIAIVYLLELFYREPLYDLSIDLAPEFQKHSELKPLFTAVSWFGYTPFSFILFMALFNIIAKPAALYIICGYSFTTYLYSELKSIYAENRP